MIANGVLVSVRHHPASGEFPGGSVTWNWHSAAPIASYLVEDSVGNYRLTKRTVNGIIFYQAQDTAISAAQQKKNQAIMLMQPDITRFESQFNGPYPFSSAGIVVGTPSVSFDEEMQTMIAFSGGTIDTGTLYHENMHQWWGDNVTEGGYRMTFYKEGLPPRRIPNRSDCSPDLPPMTGPAPPTSRCGRSSATPTSTGHCGRSSAVTAGPASQKPSWKPSSTGG